MSDPKEPSMEDILSTIRRVILRDDGARPSHDQADHGTTDTDPDSAQNDLDHGQHGVMDKPLELDAPAPQFSESPGARQALDERETTAPPPVPDAAPIVSSSTQDATRHALSALEHVMERSSSGSTTVDDLVREAIRPMLQQWLDQHLAGVVDRLVTREIERIRRGEG